MSYSISRGSLHCVPVECYLFWSFSSCSIVQGYFLFNCSPLLDLLLIDWFYSKEYYSLFVVCGWYFWFPQCSCLVLFIAFREWGILAFLLRKLLDFHISPLAIGFSSTLIPSFFRPILQILLLIPSTIFFMNGRLNITSFKYGSIQFSTKQDGRHKILMKENKTYIHSCLFNQLHRKQWVTIYY